nr:hypothetical protein [Tanacetum cinerariifolium]
VMWIWFESGIDFGKVLVVDFRSADAPPSPNHVFNFPEVEFEEDPQEEPEEDFEDDPEEDPEEDLEGTYEVGGPSYVSPFPPFYLHGCEIARLDDNTKLLLSNVQYLERCEKKRKTEMEASSSDVSLKNIESNKEVRPLNKEVRSL